MTRALLLACLALVACDEPPPPPPPPTTVTIAVTGMHCEGCAMAITEAVEKMGGVTRCEVSLEAKSAEVELDSAQVTPAEVASVIAGLGYHAGMPGEAPPTPAVAPAPPVEPATDAATEEPAMAAPSEESADTPAPASP